MRLPIETQCIENFNYETHKRGRSWIATVKKDRRAPGGLSREFWSRGSGKWAEMPLELGAGDVLEFAGDYYSGSCRKNASRKYVKVIVVTDDYIETTAPVDDESELWDLEFKSQDLQADLVDAIKVIMEKNGLHDEAVAEMLADNPSKGAIMALVRRF